MAGFCITCVKITSYAGVFLFILFGIFSFAGFKYFKMMAEEIDKGHFKEPKDKIGTEFFIAAAVYFAISVLLFLKTREPKEKKIVQTPEEEEKINKFRETLRTFSSGEIVDQIIRDNKLQDGPLFPEEHNKEEENDQPFNNNNDVPINNDQTPNLLEEQITNKKEEEPAINSQNEKFISDVGPILGEEAKQENSGAQGDVPLVSNEENQS